MLIYAHVAIKLTQTTKEALALSETQYPQLQSEKVSRDSPSSKIIWVKDLILKKESFLSRLNHTIWLLDFEHSNVKVLLKRR